MTGHLVVAANLNQSKRERFTSIYISRTYIYIYIYPRGEQTRTEAYVFSIRLALGSDSVRPLIGKTFDISNCAISYATKARRHPLILCLRESDPHWNLVRDLASPLRSSGPLEWKMHPPESDIGIAGIETSIISESSILDVTDSENVHRLIGVIVCNALYFSMIESMTEIVAIDNRYKTFFI